MIKVISPVWYQTCVLLFRAFFLVHNYYLLKYQKLTWCNLFVLNWRPKFLNFNVHILPQLCISPCRRISNEARVDIYGHPRHSRARVRFRSQRLPAPKLSERAESFFSSFIILATDAMWTNQIEPQLKSLRENNLARWLRRPTRAWSTKAIHLKTNRMDSFIMFSKISIFKLFFDAIGFSFNDEAVFPGMRIERFSGTFRNKFESGII